MKHLLILISFLLLSSPVIGQSSKYESVSQCVLQTMEERKLTGNKIFEMVKEECERSLGKVVIEKNGKGLLYNRYVNGKFGWYKSRNEKKDFSKYEGEIKNGVPNGQGTETFPDGREYVGEWKDGKPNGQGTETYPSGDKYVGEYKDGKKWNGTSYYKNGNIIGKFVNGEVIYQ